MLFSSFYKASNILASVTVGLGIEVTPCIYFHMGSNAMFIDSFRLGLSRYRRRLCSVPISLKEI